MDDSRARNKCLHLFLSASGLVIAIIGLASACRPIQQEPISVAKAASTKLSPLESAWEEYFGEEALAKRYPYELQPDCKPVFAPAAPNVAYRGTALFFHGYTSCPQQFYEMRDNLTKLGFNVLIPLLPGQGRGPAQVKGDTLAERQYYYQSLPRVEQGGGQEYIDFVAAMNAIMSKAEGLRVVGGLSVGGGLAYGAIFQSPGLYDRALVMAPFLDLPPDHFWKPIQPANESVKARWDAFYVTAKLQLENIVRKMIILNKNDWVPAEKREVRWGEACYQDNAKGRAGICDSDISQLAATVQYGNHALALAEKHSASLSFRQKPTQIQILSVEFDDGSDTRATKRTFDIVRSHTPFKIALCFFRGIPHSFLSRYDHPDLDMAWLTHFHDRARKFFVDGQFYDTAGPSQEHVKDEGITQGATQAVFPKKQEPVKPETYFDLCRQ